jgi:hypothetical protein
VSVAGEIGGHGSVHLAGDARPSLRIGGRDQHVGAVGGERPNQAAVDEAIELPAGEAGGAPVHHPAHRRRVARSFGMQPMLHVRLGRLDRLDLLGRLGRPAGRWCGGVEDPHVTATVMVWAINPPR